MKLLQHTKATLANGSMGWIEGQTMRMWRSHLKLAGGQGRKLVFTVMVACLESFLED